MVQENQEPRICEHCKQQENKSGNNMNDWVIFSKDGPHCDDCRYSIARDLINKRNGISSSQQYSGEYWTYD